MDRFPSMHDEDIEKLGIPQQQAAAGGDAGWRGRKRARELSELQGALDRAAEKEQKSWDLLKQAIGDRALGKKGGGGGRFEATGSNRAAEELQERTIGLVTAQEFRKAREEADSREQAGEKQRAEERAKREAEREAARKKAEKKKRKAEEKRQRLNQSKMSFAMEDDEAHDGDDLQPSKVSSKESATQESCAPLPTAKDQTSSRDLEEEGGRSANKGGVDTSKSCRGMSSAGPGSSSSSSSGAGGRNLKGAATDGDNSSAAAILKARLARKR